MDTYVKSLIFPAQFPYLVTSVFILQSLSIGWPGCIREQNLQFLNLRFDCIIIQTPVSDSTLLLVKMQPLSESNLWLAKIILHPVWRVCCQVIYVRDKINIRSCKTRRSSEFKDKNSRRCIDCIFTLENDYYTNTIMEQKASVYIHLTLAKRVAAIAETI